jgi:hypothetical protein
MKNLFQFHVLTLLPMMVLLGLYASQYMSSGWFIVLFLIYAFVYRPIFDYKKLREKGLVTKAEFLKSLGFVRFKYFSQLMFE